MTFDSNRAWKDASGAISANRDAVFAIAGVFFLLPSLMLALFFPQPEPEVGMEQEAIVQMSVDYYSSILPVLIPMVLVQAMGTLAILALLFGGDRPTVGSAIKSAAGGVLTYFLAQILLGLMVGLVGGLVLTIFALFGVPLLAAVGIVFAIGVAVYFGVRASLAGPVIALESERNPVAALKRSWAMTRGRAGRIALFYGLVAIAFIVAMAVISALIGIVVALFASPSTVAIVGAVISATLSAVLATYFVGIVAAVYRQLAGPDAGEIASRFD